MTRRELIKSTALVAAMPISDAMGIGTLLSRSGGFFEFTVGQLNLLVVSDGHIPLMPIQPTIAPGVATGEIEMIQKESYLPTDRLDFGINILIIKKGNRIIMVDTGCGHLYGPSSGKLIINLLSAGIHASDVTDIIITHGHIDHVGGLLHENGDFAFPNARVHMAEKEILFWMAKVPDFSKSKVSRLKAQVMVKEAKRVINALSERLNPFADGEILFNCMELEIVPGHTPGHTLLRIFSGNEQLLHLADISHTHTLLLANPEWGNSFDTDFLIGNQSRRLVLSKVADARMRVFFYHFPWPGIGFVKEKKSGFEWVPQAFSTSAVSI
jgi:glyoxylase-like metal-dependent hydrolase (beta-lactamase superfamily II)